MGSVTELAKALSRGLSFDMDSPLVARRIALNPAPNAGPGGQGCLMSTRLGLPAAARGFLGHPARWSIALPCAPGPVAGGIYCQSLELAACCRIA